MTLSMFGSCCLISVDSKLSEFILKTNEAPISSFDEAGTFEVDSILGNSDNGNSTVGGIGKEDGVDWVGDKVEVIGCGRDGKEDGDCAIVTSVCP